MPKKIKFDFIIVEGKKLAHEKVKVMHMQVKNFKLNSF